MNNGFLYTTAKYILDNLKYLTIIEWLKIWGIKLWCKNKSDRRKVIECRSNIVDGYNVFKWLFVILLFLTHATNSFLTIVIWYFIITNLYSYFYHHIWSDEAIENAIISADRARRRFFLLMLSFSYSVFCFAYLYRHPYNRNFKWEGNTTKLKSIWFSISNSLGSNYDLVKPMSEFGHSITIIQLVLTFMFVSIIISKSIPEIKK
jgi:hypothetical protein